MPNVKFKKGSAAYRELTYGLPSYIMLTIDWDDVSSKCDINRRNCAIHNALSRRDDITLPSVGFDEINFVWRGDARLVVLPAGPVAKIIALNDLASAGEIPWPTGKVSVRLDLGNVTIKRDLRVSRVSARAKREANPAAHAAYTAKSRAKSAGLDYSKRVAKRVQTEKLRGRFA